MISEPTSTIREDQSPLIVEWRPGRSEAMAWNVVAIVIVALGLPLFAVPSMLRAGRLGGSFEIGLGTILIVVVVTVLLMVAHEAIHALVMHTFGARPRFGALMVAGMMPALYATAPGHRFTRGQYVMVAVAPAVAISALGFCVGFTGWGGYLILPLAIHLGGCVGDGFATWRVSREARGTECEDLRDGVRFYRTAAG